MEPKETDPDYSGWIGRRTVVTDRIDVRPARSMQALLDRNPTAKTGDVLPPLWHWLYFQNEALQSTLDADGHQGRGDFLPPVALPRRMWAGGRFKFALPLKIGDQVHRASTIKSVQFKHGRSGKLYFVTVKHQYSVGDVFCFSEEHDIVYRDFPTKNTPPVKRQPAPATGDWQRQIDPDPLLLFRYSALTFNGHRIHYDRAYCRDVEGYSGLVFHGPLTATLLIELAQTHNPDARISGFDFRAHAPLFDTAPFTIAGAARAGSVSLWAKGPDQELSMQATAIFA